jgi:hypothetical protein
MGDFFGMGCLFVPGSNKRWMFWGLIAKMAHLLLKENYQLNPGVN